MKIKGILAAVAAVSAAASAGFAQTDGGTFRGEAQRVSLSPESLERSNDFNRDWRFHLGDVSGAEGTGFDDSSWRKVMVPHDYMISRNFTIHGTEAESGFLPGGTGWYRKSFTLPSSAAGKRVVLAFDGVANTADVYVNGKKAGENRYAYNNFEVDITDAVKADGASRNVVAVKAETVVPCSRWYSGGGILRPVELQILPSVHVAQDGVFVTTPRLAATRGRDGTAVVTTEVVNASGSAARVKVRTLLARKGEKGALDSAESKSVEIAPGATATIETTVKTENPVLWDVGKGELYAVRCVVLDADKADAKIDSVNRAFGYRWFAVDEKEGFRINGRNLKLNGVCLHHDQGALGGVFNETAAARQVAIMQDMGVNAIRTSHNPFAREFYAVCDAKGMLVLDEMFDGWDLPKNGNSHDFARYFNAKRADGRTWARYVTDQTVRRDRCSPCVFAWDIGNEISEGTRSGNGHFPKIADDLIRWVKANDTTRPITLGDNRRVPDGVSGQVNDKIVASGGFVGLNYPIRGINSVAEKNMGPMESKYRVMLISESASAINSRGVYKGTASSRDVDGKKHLTAYDTSAVGWGTTCDASVFYTYASDRRMGEFIWTGFDYIGEPTPWNGVGPKKNGDPFPNSSYFGRVDTAGFPKDSFYFLRSQWKKDSTTLHLACAWDPDNITLDKEGRAYVEVYADVPMYKLYLGDEEIAVAVRRAEKTAAGHVTYTWTATSKKESLCSVQNGTGCTALAGRFRIKFDPSKILKAKAFDQSGRKEIVHTAGVKTLANPGKTQLKVKPSRRKVRADGERLVYFEVDVRDGRGTLDTTAACELSFSLEGDGEIVGVDNGDQATVEKFANPSVLTSAKTARIKAFAGRALAIVRPSRAAVKGSVALKVSAPGMASVTERVETQPAGGRAGATSGGGLSAYEMVGAYAVERGTVPRLDTCAKGFVTRDGKETEVKGTLAWKTDAAALADRPGTHTLEGTLKFDGEAAIPVTATLKVVAKVASLREVAVKTLAGTVPALPAEVSGAADDGSAAGNFPVKWELPDAKAFAKAGTTVEVRGSASIIGERRLPVTAKVSVVKGRVESVYNAGSAAIFDGYERGEADGKTVYTGLYRWDTACVISEVVVHFNVAEGKFGFPSRVEFFHSDGNPIHVGTASAGDEVDGVRTARFRFAAPETFDAVRLRFTMDDPGPALGVKEAEFLSEKLVAE